jgi:hypothetical protein
MRLFSLAHHRSSTFTSTSQPMAQTTKTDSGMSFPREAYAYTPSDNVSEWKIRLWETPEKKETARQIGLAAAALSSGGMMGNPAKIPADDLPAVKAKVRAAWKKANPDKDPADMPDALKAAEPTPNDVHVDTPLGSTPKKRGPKQTFLNRLYTALREKFSGGNTLSQDDFNTAVKSARGHAGGKTRAENARMAAEDLPTCVIVALVPPPDVAAKLALPGGDPPEQLHLTLFHLGEADELGPFVVAEMLLAVRDVAARIAPITGTISGLGRFTAAAVDSGQDVLYASLDSPALEDLCECVEDALEARMTTGLPRTSRSRTSLRVRRILICQSR